MSGRSAISQYLTDLTETEVTRLVRRSLDSSTVHITTWETEPIASGRSGASVYRLSGMCKDGETAFPWSLILKFCTDVRRFHVEHDADDLSWQREYLLGQSGLLSDQTPGLTPAQYIDGIVLSPTEIAIWFEDVGSAWARDWSLERYGLAAFHLGQFSARFAGRPPQLPWLGRNQWPEYVEAFCPGAVESLRKHQDHPGVLAVYPAALQTRLYALNEACDDLISRAQAQSSMTLSHGDAGGRNLFDRGGETVAIDWDEVGISPVGEDVARMVGSSLHWFFIGKMDQAPALADLVLTRYLEGLHDGGFRQDPSTVACVFKAVLGTIYALSYTGIANGIVEDRIEQRARDAYQTTGPQLLEHMGAIAQFCAGQADEARALLK